VGKWKQGLSRVFLGVRGQAGAQGGSYILLSVIRSEELPQASTSVAAVETKESHMNRYLLSGSQNPRRRGRIAGLGLLVALLVAISGCIGGHVEPATSPAQLDFGVEMAKRGLWSEALFRFRQAERHTPGNGRVLNNMAVAYEALGQFENALEYYQNAIKADPANRDLKRNYSRFVEFYRAFEPDAQQDAGLDG